MVQCVCVNVCKCVCLLQAPPCCGPMQRMKSHWRWKLTPSSLFGFLSVKFTTRTFATSWKWRLVGPWGGPHCASRRMSRETRSSKVKSKIISKSRTKCQLYRKFSYENVGEPSQWLVRCVCVFPSRSALGSGQQCRRGVHGDEVGKEEPELLLHSTQSPVQQEVRTTGCSI